MLRPRLFRDAGPHGRAQVEQGTHGKATSHAADSTPRATCPMCVTPLKP